MVVKIDDLPEKVWRFLFVFANNFWAKIFRTYKVRTWSFATLLYSFSKKVELEIKSLKVKKRRWHVTHCHKLYIGKISLKKKEKNIGTKVLIAPLAKVLNLMNTSLTK